MAMSLESSIGNNENWYLLTSIHRLSDDSEASSILTTFSEISPAVTGRLRKGSRGFTGHPPASSFSWPNELRAESISARFSRNLNMIKKTRGQPYRVHDEKTVCGLGFDPGT